MNQIRILLGLAASMAIATSVLAADADPGIYGRIDVSKYPKPQLINPKPVTIDHQSKPETTAKPIYLHVPQGHEWHWHDHCKTYDACAVPVYFVTEGWFRSVYLPAIGSQDGREQRYKIQTARQRGERDRYDAHPGE